MDEEYGYIMLYYMELWNLCFTPCGLCYDLDLRSII